METTTQPVSALENYLTLKNQSNNPYYKQEKVNQALADIEDIFNGTWQKTAFAKNKKSNAFHFCGADKNVPYDRLAYYGVLKEVAAQEFGFELNFNVIDSPNEIEVAFKIEG